MRVTRRQVVAGVGAVGLVVLVGCNPLSGPEPSPEKVYRIGFLWGDTTDEERGAPTQNRPITAFRQGLRDLAYVEGQNLSIEWRGTPAGPDRLRELAAELVALPLDIIVTAGTPPTQAVQQTTSTRPIVFLAVADPVGLGFAVSLAQPGGNLTGLSDFGAALTGKRLELLQAVLPGLVRMAVLWDSTNPGNARQLDEAHSAAQALGLQLVPCGVQAPDEIAPAVEAAVREGAEALYVTGGPLTNSRARQIADLAIASHLPAMYSNTGGVYAGSLMSYAPGGVSLFRRGAAYVDRILKGARPGDLPIEQPTTFDFLINLRTAQALGLTIPEHVLLQATEVIQ